MADSKLKIWITDSVNLTGLKSLQGKLKSFGDGVKKAFHSAPVRLFRNAIVGLGAAFTGAVVEAARFNVQVARVWTMAGGGISTFKELREETRKLSSEFGLARSEIAGGMYNALSAGIDKANLESFMTTAARVAVADGSDISTAVDGITTVLNAFKVEAEETESVTDDLFQTVAQGKTTFGDLSRNLAAVAPVAAASNIPLKEILGHVASLTAQGTPTAQAMTQIRASIIGLNKALGDGWSDTMSYQEALKAVWEQSGESQTALLKLVGSTEAVQAVLGGVGINAEMAAEKLDAMNNSAGAAQAAFEKVDQFRHWPTLLETARGTLSKFGEYVDERLAPYVTNITEKLREWREDSGLWEKVGAILDKGEAKLAEIAEWMSNIKSLEDLKMAGVELGHKFTDYVIEKSKDIGASMAQGVVDGLKGMAAGGLKGMGDSAMDMMSFGMWSKSDSSSGDSSSNVAADVKEGAKQGVIEAVAQAPAKNDISIQDILAAGPTLDQLDELVSGMEMTAEELDQLIEYTEQAKDSAGSTTEAAKKSAEAAKKSADAAVESSGKIAAAMDRSKDASLAAAQAAERNTQITGQALAQIQILAAHNARLEQDVANLAGQIAMLSV
jgi:hypothetical protein